VKSRSRRWLVGLTVLTVCTVGLFHVPLSPVFDHGRGALRVEDRTGALLREPKGDDGLRADWVRLEQVPEAFVAALVQGEDHNLGRHPGVDPAGLVRALWLNLRAQRVVSGASTLAMQLARLGYDLPRSALGKLGQLALAPFLTLRLGSHGVLEAYANLAPFGRDLRGVASASRSYFGKPLRDLTVGEAVALACLPRGPSHYDPYRHPERLKARRAHVLGLMVERGVLSASAAQKASREPLHLVPFVRTFRAPHASALSLHEAHQQGIAHPTRIRTTLDAELQRTAQWACKQSVAQLQSKAATHCAVVAMRASTGEVLALVGSPDFRSAQGGQVNAALALRQPGSALKPFVYALAFERGRAPGSSIEDVPTSFAAPFGLWTPRNYDGHFHGTVTLRESLANSYNIPAIKLVDELSPALVVERLVKAGLGTLEGAADRLGVGIALGDGEVTLLDLVSAYATLARGGEYLEPTLLAEVEEGVRPKPLRTRVPRRVFSRSDSYLVGHVLQDRAARRAAFGEASALELPFAAAVKTGTSSDYRDNWTLGYAGDLVVGVWVGRHDGAPMFGVSGVSGAAPAWRRIMLYALGKTAGAWPAPPACVERVRLGARLDLRHRPACD
jgi:penicillin-binding protein 1C